MLPEDSRAEDASQPQTNAAKEGCFGAARPELACFCDCSRVVADCVVISGGSTWIGSGRYSSFPARLVSVSSEVSPGGTVSQTSFEVELDRHIPST